MLDGTRLLIPNLVDEPMSPVYPVDRLSLDPMLRHTFVGLSRSVHNDKLTIVFYLFVAKADSIIHNLCDSYRIEADGVNVMEQLRKQLYR